MMEGHIRVSNGVYVCYHAGGGGGGGGGGGAEPPGAGGGPGISAEN